ncbi:MAG TPA: hypothetical protein VGF79_02140 [Bacteroidia bacterium]
MKNLNDLIGNLRERFTNPFFFSFICSWSIINWKIIIALIWFGPDQFSKSGDYSIFKFIEQNTTTSTSFWYPILLALIYTFLNPILKNIIIAFYTWSSKWGEKWNLKILKEGYISINKYMKLRSENEKQSLELMQIIQNESVYIDNFNRLQNDKNTLQQSYNDLRSENFISIDFIQKLNNIKLLNGTWEKTYISLENNIESESVTIEEGKYYIQRPTANKIHVFNIFDFYFDNKNQKLFFIKELVQNERANKPKEEYFLVNRLHFEGNDILVGTENLNRVQYKRR